MATIYSPMRTDSLVN